MPTASDHTPAEIVTLLSELGMTQVAAAAALGVGDRSMRRYCAEACPHHIWLALCQLRDLRIRAALDLQAKSA
jgi:hypothetical protein